MKKTRRIVLYGTDLVVSTVGENLRGRADVQLIQVDPLLPDAVQRLRSARADVVLFDLAGTRSDFAVTVLREHPSVLLIGLDLKTNKVLVMSGRESHLVTLDDLVGLVAETS